MNRQYTVADAILDTLKAHGITTMFGYPGGAILPFYDALPYHAEIKHVLVRHEQAAAFAAEGWARSTKQIGVCVATSGPGATNLLTGIADAYMDSIPLLCITGQVPLSMIGKDMFQEVDVTGITLSITKHNYLVDDPKKIVNIVTEAIAIAVSGRPGPVLIDVPKDIMASPHPEQFDIPEIHLENDPQRKALHPVENDVIQEIVEAINTAKKPVLIAGHGIVLSSAEKEFTNFVEKTGIPVVTTLLGKACIDPKNKHRIGMLGMHGFFASNSAVHNADLIINIGSRFDDRIVGTYGSFGKHAKIIHIDIDQAEMNKVVKAHLSVHSDAKQAIEQILAHPECKKLDIAPWWNQIRTWEKECPYEKHSKEFTARSVLALLMEEMEKNPEKYILVTDVGQHQMWTALSCETPFSTHWLTSGGSGAMGFGLPTALGAAAAHPDKTIICVSGDGGIQMNSQELQTVHEYNYNIKIIVLNNSFLGMVRQWQELFYAHNYSHVNISSPDYVKLAEAYRIPGTRYESEAELKKSLQTKLTSPKAELIECLIKKEDNLFPMVPGGKTLGETIMKKI